ncbi:hypothetical protein S83_028956, partial [Arachis hypogaea]
MMLLVRVVVVVLLFLISFFTTIIEAFGHHRLEPSSIITPKNLFKIDNDDVNHNNFLKSSSSSHEQCCKNCYHHEGLLFDYYLCQDTAESCHESCKNCICTGYFSPQRCHCRDIDSTQCPIPE